MSLINYLIGFAIISCVACGNNTVQATLPNETQSVKPFRLSSPAFKRNDTIPTIYTCDSLNISPELHWSNPFQLVNSFALIMDDPDVPTQAWVHWIVYNIPATDTILPMHLAMDSVLPNGTKQGFTSFRITGYGGPCPPDGMHHYLFKLYALDAKLKVPARLTKSQLLDAMNGHIIGETDFTCLYARHKKEQ